MLAAKTELKNAEKVKQYLLKHHLLHPEYLLVKEFGFLYFPLVKKIKIPGAEVIDARFSFPAKQKPVTVEQLLTAKLTKEELEHLPKSQEVVGTILILEIPEFLQKKEKVIAQAYLQSHKNITTVVRKDKMHQGTYRLRKVKVLAGINTKETIHLESGVKIKLDLEKTYFSARLAHERLRLAQQVKPKEEILVMFSGAGPYVLVLSKHTDAKKIVGIEINPLAHRYAVDNVVLNNCKNSTVHLGDVYKVIPTLSGKFDRIVMPLPKTGEEYLPLALTKARAGSIIHLYGFLQTTEVQQHRQKIKALALKAKHPVRILRTVECGSFSPGTSRFCFDLKVLK